VQIDSANKPRTKVESESVEYQVLKNEAKSDIAIKKERQREAEHLALGASPSQQNVDPFNVAVLHDG